MLIGGQVLRALWFSVVLLGSVAHASAQTCDERRLHQALLQHDKAKIEFQYKMQTGFIRRLNRGDFAIAADRNAALYAGPQQAVRAIANHLTALDDKLKTYALVYEPQLSGCVWLISPTGIVEGESGRWSTKTAADISAALGADGRVAARLPKLRSPQVPRDLDTSQVRPDPNTLRDVGADLLPRRIAADIQSLAKRLLILPSSDLSTVPFAALQAWQSPAYLIDTVLPIVLPSIDGLFFWVKAPVLNSRAGALIVGDPDLSRDPVWEFSPLPGALREAELAADRFGRQALTGTNATLKAVSQGLTTQSLSLIYFATHGIADSVNPMDDSFLALTGGHLKAQQIKNLSFPTTHPLVVMSACQSGLGKTFSGGVFGLARAWIQAGASQVIASNWNVDDEDTFRLMGRFIDDVVAGRSTESAFHGALKAAKRDSDPSVWGAFSLFGYPQPER